MSNSQEAPFRLLGEDEQPNYFQPETPFLDTRFSTEAWFEQETTTATTEQEQGWTSRVETPFLTEYAGGPPVNAEAQALEEALANLYDRDFNEAVANLAMEAAAQAESFALLGGETETSQLLTEWLDPLRKATEQLFEQIGDAASRQQLESFSEAELNTFFEGFVPQPGAAAPQFEDFLKKVWGKIKSVASSAVKLATKGIGVLLKKLGRLVRPLLEKVLRFARGRLPANLRPAATLLGRRLGILRETFAEEGETPTTPALEALSEEFDASVATLLFARGEDESELFLNEVEQETLSESETGALSELDAARERFVTQFSQLQANENAGPVIQQFIPAILPLLKVGITVVGRSRVVNFLAGLLAKLIQKFVGPAAATTLSRALVDVGLRTIALEAETEPPPRLAARTVAAALEDTVRRVAGFGFESFGDLEGNLEQQRLLEAVASEAFFEAAVAHFPAQLLDVQRLQEREMYLESSVQQEVWAYRPRPRYKKYTRVFEVNLTPQIAAQVRSFGNQPLDALLRVRGARLPATVKVHLYEAIPGTTLSHIAVLEKRTPGLGSGSEAAWSKIHPLSTQAAGILLREPGLGRDLDPRFLETRHRIAVGQRFYYLEMTQGTIPGPVVGRPSEVNITIDLPVSQVRVNAYFSEADAQRVVAAGPNAGPAVAVRVAFGLAQGAVNSIATGPTNHVTIKREAAGEQEGEEFWQRVAGEAGKRAARWILEELAKVLAQMIKAALIRYFNARLAEFDAATKNPASGVTLVFTFNHPGLRVLHAALAGRVPGLADVRAAARALQLPSVRIAPGFTRA